MAKGRQGPDLQGGTVGTSGRVSLRSSHLQVISLRGIKKWDLWSSGIENAFLQAGGFARNVFLQGPVEWGPLRSDRIWKLQAPGRGLNDAPAAFRRSPKRHILDPDNSMRGAGLRCQASLFDPCPLFVFRGKGVRRVRLPLNLMIFLGAANQMF